MKLSVLCTDPPAVFVTAREKPGAAQAAVAEQFWVEAPEHWAPPFAGAGLVQLRVNVLAG